jgi:hypothetical protein
VYYAVRPGDPNILIAEGTLDKQDVRATIPSPVVGSLVTVRCECTAAPGHQQTEVEITFTQDVDTLPVLPDQSPPVPHVPKAPCWHEYRLVTKGNS